MEQLVKLVSPESESLAGAFGVTDERAEQLSQFLQDNEDKWFVDGNDISVILSEASSICVHPNEILLQGYALGRIIAGKMDKNPLSALLKSLL